MIRSFLSVGQGAFYVEQFHIDCRRINIVYDCGSSSGLKNLKRKIKQTFREGEEIDSVFISHFDEDHINGLETLLMHCRVRNLFYPLITQEIREIFTLEKVVNSEKDGFTTKFLSNPRNALEYTNSSDARLFSIREVNDASNRIEWEYNSINEEQSEMIISGTNVTNIIFEMKSYIYNEWFYIPYNYRQSERFEQFKNKFYQQTGIEYTLENALAMNVNKLKEIYKLVDGNLNANSMVLLSCHSDPNVMQHLDIHRNYDCFPETNKLIPSGCLYFGDYNLSKEFYCKELLGHFEKYIDNIGIIQVPHHGSKNSFNSSILFKNIKYCVISAGNKNRYSHPHFSVINEIEKHGKIPFVVNEYENSEVVFCGLFCLNPK